MSCYYFNSALLPVRRDFLNHGYIFTPEHFVCRISKLIFLWKIEPDLKKLQRVGLVLINQRKHLGMLTPFARRQPLHIPLTVTPFGSKTVKMIHKSFRNNGNRFKPAMRVYRKSRNFLAVIHPVSIFNYKITANISAGKLVPINSLIFITRRIIILVMRTEKKWIFHLPLKANFLYFEYCFVFHIFFILFCVLMLKMNVTLINPLIRFF